MILKESIYYEQFIGKTVKVNFNDPSDNHCIGILKNIYANTGVNYEITFNLSPKMCLNPPDGICVSDFWEVDHVTYTNQDQIFENYYWSTISYNHSIVSNVISHIEIVESFEKDVENWSDLGPLIHNKFIKIDFPFFDLVNSFLDGKLLIEI